MKQQSNREDHPYFQELRNPYPMKQQVNNKCVTSSTINVEHWIIEAKSAHNDGYTQLYYCVKLQNNFQGIPVYAYPHQLIVTKITGE